MGTTGIGGALVVGRGIREVAHDGDGAVAGDGLDGAAEVAGGAGENLTMTGSTPGTLESAFVLLPGATEEAFLLEILLEHTDGEVAQFLWQVARELALQGSFEALEVVREVLDCHDYKKKLCQFQKRLYLCSRKRLSDGCVC